MKSSNDWKLAFTLILALGSFCVAPAWADEADELAKAKADLQVAVNQPDADVAELMTQYKQRTGAIRKKYSANKGPDQFKVAETALQEGRIDNAVAAIQDLLKKEPANGDALTILGNIALMTGDLPAALSFYKQAIDADPSKADFFNNLHLAQLQAGQFDEAYESLMIAVRLDPRHISALYNLGNLLMTGHDLLRAAEYYRKVVDIDLHHAGAHYKLASLYMAVDETDAAIPEYEAALESDPGYVDARVDFGLALIKQGEKHAAAEHFRLALEKDPTRAAAHYGIGLAMREWGFKDAAVDTLKKAVELAPENVDYRIDLALAVLDSGVPEAVDICEQLLFDALDMQPDHVRANYLAGLFYSDADQPKFAAALLQRAIDLGYSEPDARLSLAQNYLKLGETDKARAILQDLDKNLPQKNEIREQAHELLKNT